MGYHKAQWEFLNKSLRLAGFMGKNDSLLGKERFAGKKILELGCQFLRYEVCKKMLYKVKVKDKVKDKVKGKMKKKMLTGISGNKKGVIAKRYFEYIGFEHMSFDISGGGGSLKTDLRDPIDNSFYNRFDIVTNSGTTEHVSPLDGQYECFKNVHLCTKVNGIMVHMIPFSGLELPGHCQIFYTNEFFETLAKLNKYKLILSEKISVKTIKLRKKTKKISYKLWGSKIREFTLMGFCFIKMEDNLFSQDKKKILEYINYIDV